MNTAACQRGLLFPTLPALLEYREGGSLRLVDATIGLDLVADGVLGRELERAIERGERGPMLTALGDAHPVTRALARLAGVPREPLNATTALAMGGFDTLFVELTGRCGERCIHCYAGSGPTVVDALTRDTWSAVIEDAAALGFRRVQLTGGDPLLCDFVVDAVREVGERGIAACEIFTNGLTLSDTLLDALEPLTPSFAISFYSDKAQVHDEITGVYGSHARTSAAIRRVVKRGLPIRGAVIVLDENASHVTETMACLRSLGVEKIGVSGSRAVGRGRRVEPNLTGLRCDTHRGNREDGEPRTHGSLCVASNGDVLPCIFNRTDILGRVPARRLRDIATSPDFSPGAEQPAVVDLEECRSRLQCTSCQLTAMALRVATAG